MKKKLQSFLKLQEAIKADKFEKSLILRVGLTHFNGPYLSHFQLKIFFVTSGNIGVKRPLVFGACLRQKSTQRHLFHFSELLTNSNFYDFSRFLCKSRRFAFKKFSPSYWKKLGKNISRKKIFTFTRDRTSNLQHSC